MTRNKKSPEKAQRNMNRFKNILFYTVLTLLLLSAIFTLVMIVVAPADRDLDEAFTKVKSDYILMFIQCLAAAGVLLLPSLLQHKFRIEIPNLMTIILVLFVFAAAGQAGSAFLIFALSCVQVEQPHTKNRIFFSRPLKKRRFHRENRRKSGSHNWRSPFPCYPNRRHSEKAHLHRGRVYSDSGSARSFPDHHM